MSFRLFIYYCAAWGAAAAYFGWVAGKVVEGDSALLGATLRGLALGVFLSLGLGLVDGLAIGSQRNLPVLFIRLALTMMIGGFGGLLGGFIGQGFVEFVSKTWLVNLLLTFGWTLTGVLIGLAPASFDYLTALVRGEDRRGVNRKVRNGLLGGFAGGLCGGVLSLYLRDAWGGLFKVQDVNDLWSPSAAGFVALGACIGLAVALAQIILRESWIRVEAGFRPGRQLLLTRPETTIGRAEACDVGLFGDAGVEKLHAKIVRQGDYWLLQDMGTPSGTLVNGQHIAGPTPLSNGDRIEVGGSVLSFGTRARQAAALPVAVAVAP